MIDALSRPPWPTIADAADAVGVPSGTAKRWHSQPAFKAAVDAAVAAYRAESISALERQIDASGEHALAALLDNLAATDESVRHRAATYLLDRILGKPKERREVAGQDGDAIAVKARVTHEHEFDYDGFAAAFASVLAGASQKPTDADGTPEPVDTA